MCYLHGEHLRVICRALGVFGQKSTRRGKKTRERKKGKADEISLRMIKRKRNRGETEFKVLKIVSLILSIKSSASSENVLYVVPI